uniref:Beta-catenin-like protein 1 n=1 Tax=Strigamia maritima TaxID=126957 RepID=T1J520_STRMM
MDVEELLAYKPSSGPKRRTEEDEIDDELRKKAKRLAKVPDPAGEEDVKVINASTNNEDDDVGISNEEREQILKMVEAEPEIERLDDIFLKKLILTFEKKVLKNQELRIKFPELPEKFMESEVELNDAITEMHVVATQPDLYHILVELSAVQSFLGLLTHENTDIAIAVVDLIQELTDVDTLNESEDGAAILIDSLLEGQIIALMVQNLDRLDESVKEESEGIHNTLAIIENIVEFKPEICIEAAQQGLLQWILKRLKAKIPFESNKLYASEILSILLQGHEENRQLLGEVDGIDVLLQQLAFFKRHDPSTGEENEMMENLFNSLSSALMHTPNRERFLKGEGLQLMNLMLREKKLSRSGALKVLDHAMCNLEGADNCNKFVDILGLRTVFPLFMKTPQKQKRKGLSTEDHEEHVCSILASMLKNCKGNQRQRLMNKFTENDHEKVDRLMELHFKYLEKVQVMDNQIEKEKLNLQKLGEEIDFTMEDDFYLQRLDAGLFTLQLIDYIMLECCASVPPSIKQRVLQMLNLRGGSIKTIRNIMRECAGNIGNAKDDESREIEQQRILQLVDKF